MESASQPRYDSKYIEFKTKRQKEEWENSSLSGQLRELVIFISHYAYAKFNKKVVITDIFRKQEEQDNIYRDSERYQKNPWKSVHQYWRGVDLRSRTFEKEEITEMQSVLNKFIYDPSRPGKRTCLVHNVGKGMHFHIQTFA